MINKTKVNSCNIKNNNTGKSNSLLKEQGKKIADENIVIEKTDTIQYKFNKSKEIKTNVTSIDISRIYDNDYITYLRNMKNSDGINEFISSQIFPKLSNDMISNNKDNKIMSIPLPNINPENLIEPYINKIKTLDKQISLPFNDDFYKSKEIQKTLDTELIKAIEEVTILKNPELLPYTKNGKTTSKILTSFNKLYEEKMIASSVEELSENPFIDMGINNLFKGQVLYWDGSSWLNGYLPLNIEQLKNVNVANVASGQVLASDGSKWRNTNLINGATFNLEDALNVNASNDPNNNTHYLGWDNTAKKWTNRQINYLDVANVPGILLNDLTDVIINVPTSNQVLYYDGINWINSYQDLETLNNVNTNNAINNDILMYNGNEWTNKNAKNSINIDDLKNINISNPSNGQIIQFNGTNWVNVQLPSMTATAIWNIIDKKTQGTLGGTATTNIWSTREINNIVLNGGSDVTLLNNQIILFPGNYIVDITTQFNRTNLTKIRIMNVTDNNVIDVSNNMNCVNNVQMCLNTNININVQKTIELQYYASNSVDMSDLGVACGIDEEIYTNVRINKIVLTQLVWMMSDTKLIGTVGGQGTLNLWSTRDFNTNDLNSGADVVLNNNIFTVNPGTYNIDVSSTFNNTGNTKLRFFDITNNNVVSSSCNLRITENLTMNMNFNVSLLIQSTYKLEYYVTNSGTNIDLGIPCGIDNEIYSKIRFTKF